MRISFLVNIYCSDCCFGEKAIYEITPCRLGVTIDQVWFSPPVLFWLPALYVLVHYDLSSVFVSPFSCFGENNEAFAPGTGGDSSVVPMLRLCTNLKCWLCTPISEITNKIRDSSERMKTHKLKTRYDGLKATLTCLLPPPAGSVSQASPPSVVVPIKCLKVKRRAIALLCPSYL